MKATFGESLDEIVLFGFGKLSDGFHANVLTLKHPVRKCQTPIMTGHIASQR